MLDNNFLLKLHMICPQMKLKEPMKNHTSFRIGGACDSMVFPKNEDTVWTIVSLCKEFGVPYFVMGNGSNLLISDKGIRGVVIKLGKSLQNAEVFGETIVAGSGILLSKLSKLALDRSLTGLEFAAGIPGTLGGAVVMNAGAYGGEIKDVVVSTKYIDSEGCLRKCKGSMHEFGYRHSRFSNNNCIILSSMIKLKKGNKSEIKAKMEELAAMRKEKQPLEYGSAGSTFKRPEGYFAAKLIEDSGLKGLKIGGAEVSEKHAGFVINKGNATAEDVIELMQQIKKTVEEKYGIELEPEVKIIGEL